jgi:hypothetical protein
MQSLQKLLKKKRSVKRVPILDEKTIFFVFRKIIQKKFGEIGKEKLIPDFFSKKTIFIKSQSPAWAAELWLNKAMIIREMNKDLGEGTLEKIKIK